MDIVLDKNHSHRVLPLSPVCTQCVHLTDVVKRKCAAFKEGIPLAIWNGSNAHRAAYPGDGGIRFEQRESSSQQAA